MTEGRTMEIDALRAALAAIGERGGEIVLPGTAATRKARRSVDALVRWQIVQAGAGIAIAVAGGIVWTDLLAWPGLLFASGLLVNVYGAAMTALGIAGLAHAARIDMAGSLVETENHMARLHRIKLASGWVLGASWWVLWLPFTAVLARLLWGSDMLAAIGVGPWFVTTLGSGAAGWAGTALLRRWALRHGHGRLAARIDEALTGRGFQEARQRIDAVTDLAAGRAR